MERLERIIDQRRGLLTKATKAASSGLFDASISGISRLNGASYAGNQIFATENT